jgi:hypothetical protein
MALNTTRGIAMHAAIRYALWVKAQLGTSAEKTGFADIREVQEVLDAHLDPVRDSSLAIRSVYSQFLPWLIFLDEGWVKVNLSRIFPTDEGLAQLRDAAWDTYVVFCHAYDNVADILKEEYGRAAGRLNRAADDEKRMQNPADHLAEHLLILYWRGKIELDGPELTAYYREASDKVHGHGMWFVGRVFSGEGDDPPMGMIDRLKRLFEARLELACRNPENHRRELEQFGSWFASGRFGAEWSLENLLAVVRLVGSAEPDGLVMDRLVKWARTHTVAVLECVRAMIDGAKELWKIEAWRNEIRQIVHVARQGEEAARHSAETLVNILAARGYLDFRDLLDG